MPLFGMGLEHLDLALDNVQEAIHRVADPGHDVAGAVRLLASDRTDGVDVPCRERNPFHHLKIGADSFHPSATLRGLGTKDLIARVTG